MSKISEQERQRLIKLAKEARKNAPVMPEADARRLSEKWNTDAQSLDAKVITNGNN